jgi:GntR family transcriptional regulator
MCHKNRVTLIKFKIEPGGSVVEQLVFAAQKAFLSGEFSPGQEFPSVRMLAAELKIHPNTAHKVIQQLIEGRWLEARPGLATIVAAPPVGRARDRKRLLLKDVERLVVDAKSVGLNLHDLVQAISAQWNQIDDLAAERRK